MLKSIFVDHIAAFPWAYPIDGETLRVVVRAERGTVQGGKTLYGDKYTPTELSSVPLVKKACDGRFDYFTAELKLNPPRLQYVFLLEGENGTVWFHEQGICVERSSVVFFQYPYINEADMLDTPQWLTDGVVYQIFPDRFEKGDPTLDPVGVTPWDNEKPTRASIYGGDLEGIIRRLPHLQELGVTVLYLTPIFTSPSNHKYDTSDYFNIDPHFGDKETLKELVDACHGVGIRVILDAVYNHCGKDFFAFKDVIDKGKKSKYADWFHIHSFPVQTEPVANYETFSNNITTMPKLRTGHPEVREYFLGVARYWIEEFNIDGWRLDVANEVDHVFWREFRKAVKEVNPDAYIIGEVWHEASPWLQGDQFDGVTNYPLREACLDFFAHGDIDAERFAERIQRNLFIYPEQMLRASWNVLSSHDTERFITACDGDDRKANLGIVFNFTWIGTPLIYYGDEIGMEGENDPDCRRPMIWDRGRWNKDMFGLHRLLTELRSKEVVFRQGSAKVLYADAADNTLVFARSCAKCKEQAFVALNNSNSKQIIPLDAHIEFVDKYEWRSLTGDVQIDKKNANLILGPYASVVGLQA